MKDSVFTVGVWMDGDDGEPEQLFFIRTFTFLDDFEGSHILHDDWRYAAKYLNLKEAYKGLEMLRRVDPDLFDDDFIFAKSFPSGREYDYPELRKRFKDECSDWIEELDEKFRRKGSGY